MVGRAGTGSVRQLVLAGSSQEAEGEEYWYLAPFLLFMESGTSAIGMGLPTFWVRFSSSVSPLWKHTYTCIDVFKGDF